MIGTLYALSLFSFLLIFVRLYTQSLVSGVSGNNYASFTSYDAAQVHYTANRDSGRIVRTSMQDEVIFRSLEDAIDVNWRGY